MPRIWMTYAELADLLDCSPTDARDYAIARSLVRRKGRSGLTHTELDGQLTLTFIDRVRGHDRPASPEIELEQAIADLLDIHEEMARKTDVPLLRKQV